MKQFRIYHILLLAAVALGMAGCETDNMDAPNCHVHGYMSYNGNPIGVRGSGQGNQTNGSVQIELWQSGFGKEAALNVNVAQDGSFSTYIYGGDVRIVTKSGVGPWNDADTLRLSVKGDTEVNYEVKPFFTISDVDYSFDAADSLLTASFYVTQVDEEATVRSMGLLVNNTQFVDLAYNKATSTGVNQIGKVSFKLDCRQLASCKSLYARVFVRSSKSNDAVYSTTPYKVW